MNVHGRRLVSIALVTLFASGCGRRSHDLAKEHSAAQSASPSGVSSSPGSSTIDTSEPWLENAWEPKTGRGMVTHHQPAEGTMRTSFHVGFPGYTGGLVIGGYSSSGLAWIPNRLIPGFPSINVFCAQDESIWDHDERREYTYGWSENFGTGPDGERLEYISGRIVEATRKSIVLESENAGGCYRVRKVASTWATTRFWIIATRVTNRCSHPIHFDFFSGDDPWIGLYKSSDGDVGWTQNGVVRNERRLEQGDFTLGGLWDLGNAALGQSERTFSNQANFFALDPTLPLPDEADFANRFAHKGSEVDPTKPLDNKSMTAINLGWTNQTLLPEAFRDFVFAMGLAETSDTAEVPSLPEIRDEHWSRWRRLLNPNGGSVRDSAEFVAELVELDVTRHGMNVSGTYYVHNPTTAGASFTIGFPINVTKDRPAPKSITVDGREFDVVAESSERVSAQFPISVPAQSVRSFNVRYSQPHQGRRAEYVVTSALSWKRPIDRAVFRIRVASELGPVRTSYPARTRRGDGGTRILTIVRQPFVPDRELTIAW